MEREQIFENPCERCLFKGRHIDMGWSADVCRLQDNLADAVRYCDETVCCGYRLTMDEAKAFAKARSVVDGFDEHARQATCYALGCQMADKLVSSTVRKMQEEIKARCLKGGLYPAFVARTIEKVAEEMLEGTK